MPIWRGTTSTDWNTASNWVIDGSGNSGVPTATTDAIFDATSTLPCVLGANRVCRDLTFTAFPSTLAFATFTLQVNRNVTLQSDIASRVTGSTGGLLMAQGAGAVSGTITPNSGIWPINFTAFGHPITITLAANFTVAGNVSIFTGATYSGNVFNCQANFTSNGGGSLATSTTNFIMTGTGNLFLFGACNMELNTLGTITVTSNIVTSRRFIITNVGTLNGLGSFNFTFQPTAATNTLDFGPGNRSVQDFATNTAANTTTILNSFTCRDFSLIATTYNGPTSPSTTTITITRNYNNTSIVTTNGTLFLVMNAASGAGSIASSAQITTLPLTINASANTITYAGNFNIGNGANFTRTSGNINAGLTTATIPGGTSSVTISNLIFNNLTVTPTTTLTVTQNALNTINGVLLINWPGFNTIFAGTAGWTCASLVITVSGVLTITLRNGVTYTTTTAVQLTGATNTNRYTIISDNASFRAIWTVGSNATQAITYVDGTRIDSSGGATVWTLGTVGTTAPATLNWNNGSQPSTVGYTFVN
jgi:hypothetical protein